MNDAVLIIISSHNSQRLFTYAPLIASSTPFVLVGRVQLEREVGLGDLLMVRMRWGGWVTLGSQFANYVLALLW